MFNRFLRFAGLGFPGLALLVLSSGCGGSNSASAPVYPTNVTIAMSPTLASIATGSTQQFTVAVTNYSGSTAFWGLQNSTLGVGSVTQQGLYTAPPAPPVFNYGGGVGTQGNIQIYVSEAYPTGVLGGAVVKTQQDLVVLAPSITAGFFTASATVPLGGSVRLQPYAVGAMNHAYTLQVQGVTGGSIAYGTIVQDSMNAGLYTAPAAMPVTGNTVVITVTSSADPAKTGTALVTLQ